MSTDYLPLFDQIFSGPAITAVEVKREAIARVERNANPEWKAAFRRALEYVAKRQLMFTADPVWKRFEQDYPHPETHEPRAAGAIVVQAMKDKVIVTTDQFWNSERRSCHGRKIQAYRSLIYDPQLAADREEIEGTQ